MAGIAMDVQAALAAGLPGHMVDRLRLDARALAGAFGTYEGQVSAGIERGATLAMRHADEAIIVSNPEVSSVRDCDRIIGLLDAKTQVAEQGGRMPKHLLITRYDSARAKTGEMLATDDVVDILSVPLIGVIPESKDVLKASNVGLPVTLADEGSPAARAYMEATRRLLGENIPVTIPEEKKGLFGKIFKGRAA